MMKFSRFQKIWIGFGLLVALVFGGIVLYAAAVMPRMSKDSLRSLNQFLALTKARDYNSARAMTSDNLQDALSQQQLVTLWRKFEADHGAVTRWFPVDDGGYNTKGSGRRICILPPFVDYTYAVEGTKKNGIIIYLRVAPHNGQWRIERFSQLRPIFLGQTTPAAKGARP